MQCQGFHSDLSTCLNEARKGSTLCLPCAQEDWDARGLLLRNYYGYDPRDPMNRPRGVEVERSKGERL